MADYKTARGVEVNFVGIATLLDKLNGQFRLPDPPSYEVKLATGGTERHVHDETTVQTDEEKKALADYQSECTRITNEHALKLTRLVVLRGMTFDYPASDDWVKEQEFLGIQVPADPMERRLHYVETEVLGTKEDVEAVMLGVMRASGVNEEMVLAMEDSFRHPLGKSEGNETLGADAAPDGAGMALCDPIRAGDGGVRPGQVAKRVRRRQSGR